VAKPVVDRIEQELADEATVLRLDVNSDAGSEAIKRYGIRGLPTLIVVDGCGEAVAKYAGVPNASGVVETVRSTPTCSQ
jgi:thiol:disulfide interchange protein